jgi:hypothetical protein
LRILVILSKHKEDGIGEVDLIREERKRARRRKSAFKEKKGKLIKRSARYLLVLPLL